MPILLVAFYFFAVISIYLGVLSLRGGIRFVRYLQTERAKSYSAFTPYVTVFLPLRGVDEGLRENLLALFAQQYPRYEVILVSDSENDPAWQIVAEVRRSFAGQSGPTVQTVVAGQATDRGQKVHNLTVAVAHADTASEVFAFVDSDARVIPDWLRSLVAPLQGKAVGATTGYRWFVPVRGGFSSYLLSVWNAAIASALGADEKKNFCWGGSTAIRRSTFTACNVLEHWRGTVSDDFAVTRALHAEGWPIKFVPRCLTPTFEDCSSRELLEFTTRQLRITRAYAAHLWQAVFFGSAIFVVTFFGGLGLVLVRAGMGLSITLPLALLLIIFVMGALKSYLRNRAVAAIIGDARAQAPALAIAHLILWPAASALYLHNALAAAVSRRINWRGITYELKSPPETVIIHKQRSEVRDQTSA